MSAAAVLSLLLSIVALITGAVAALAGNRANGAAALGVCALSVALLCAVNGQADLGAAIAVLYAGGLAASGLVLARSCAPHLPSTSGHGWGRWPGLLAAGLLLGVLSWATVRAPGSPEVAMDAAALAWMANMPVIIVLTAMLLCLGLVSIVALTARAAGTAACNRQEDQS